MLGRLRIRGKLVLLVVIPLVAVGMLAVPLILDRAEQARRAAATAESVRIAGRVGTLIQDLQQERLLAIGHLLGQVDRASVQLHRAAVDDRVADILITFDGQLPDALDVALRSLPDIADVRAAVLQRTAQADQPFVEYGAIIGRLIDALQLGTDVDVATPVGRQVVALDAALRADEAISYGATLLLVVVATKSPRAMTQAAANLAELQSPISLLFKNATEEQRALYALVQEAFLARVGADFISRFSIDPARAIENLTLERFYPSVASFIGLGRFVERKIITDVTSAVAREQRTATLTAYAVAGVALLVVLIVVLLSLAIGRAITGPLSRLTRSADLVARVAESELQRVADGEVDSTEPIRLAAIDSDSRDEIGELARAFQRVQLTAAGLVERQVASRRNVAQMFGHVGRRTQNLVGLQLSLIDTLEREEVDPDRLRRLYRLDHVSSRLRRNAGSLVVLSGVPSSGTHSAPLPLADVVRLALGEIEDYTRVDLDLPSDIVVALPVIEDLVLVLAELMENATVYSPPDTRVRVLARAIEPGVRITIADRGIGLPPHRLAEENARLAHRERLDLAPTEVLGLFVVGRLARRHQMTVVLSETPGGGTTATVDLGHHLLAIDTTAAPLTLPGTEPVALPAGSAAPVSPAPASRVRSIPQLPPMPLTAAAPAATRPATPPPLIPPVSDTPAQPVPARLVTPSPAAPVPHHDPRFAPAPATASQDGGPFDATPLRRAAALIENGQSWNAFSNMSTVDGSDAQAAVAQPAPITPTPITPATVPTATPPTTAPSAAPVVGGLRQRVPGAQMPEGALRPVPDATNPEPATAAMAGMAGARAAVDPTAEAEAARALVEQFEAGAARATHTATGTATATGTGTAAVSTGHGAGNGSGPSAAPNGAMPGLTRRVPGANMPVTGPGGRGGRGALIPTQRQPEDPQAARDLIEQFESGVARAERENAINQPPHEGTSA